MGKLRELKISNEKLTNRTENTSRYFNEIEKIKMLKPEEEFSIAMMALNGDEQAINTLIKANLRFVVSVAKQYSNMNVSLDELICQGNIGLIHAAQTFDPTRGFKFISYAVWHIRKEILNYFSSNIRIVKIPQNIISTLSHIRRIDETILQTEGRAATVSEIQEELAKSGKIFNEDQIKRMLGADAKVSSLDSSEIEDSLAPIDWISSESTALENVDKLDLESIINTMVGVLSPMQREIVTRRLGIGLAEPETFTSISRRFDRTPEWARQIYDKSIRKMRAKFIRRSSYMNA